MSATAVDFGRPELERQASTRAESWFSWGGAIGLLVLVVWAVPIKTYRLPVALPFSLETYRLLLIVLVGAWLVAIVTGTRGVSAAGLGKPLGLLGAVGVLSIVANTNALSAPGSSRRRSSPSRTSSVSCSPTCSSARRSRRCRRPSS